MSVLHSALIKQATTLSEAGMTQIIILWKQTVIIKNRVEKKKNEPHSNSSIQLSWLSAAFRAARWSFFFFCLGQTSSATSWTHTF